MAAAPNFDDRALNAPSLGDERLVLAYEEGHDADIPSNLGVYHPAAKPASVHDSAQENDLELGVNRPGSSADDELEAADGVDEKEAEVKDLNVVWWEEPADKDPANPMNWTEGRKWGNIAVLSIMTLITPLASSMFAPGIPRVMRDFHSNSDSLATFVVSVYVLGFAIGPLLVAPLSEMYGRIPLYFSNFVLFVVFTIACAVSSNLSMLIGFRFLQGCVGSAPLTIGGGTIADLMPQERRGGALAIWAMGPLLGPVIGPVAGGYLVESKGWRWVYWVLAIVSGVFCVISFFLMQETYAPAILGRKAARLRKQTGNPNLRSKLDTGLSHKELLLRSIVRPTRMLLLSPIIQALCLYTAIVYGILYLLFTTFTYVFEINYGFSTSNAGLTYIGIGVGMIIGLGVVGFASDKIIKAAKARGDELKPELRMPLRLMLPGALAMPVGLFIYGWTAQYRIQWAVPLLGTMIVGFGLLAIFMCIQTYLVDAFTVHAASAMAANAVLRSFFGALLPLGGLSMYNVLGLGWGNSLLAFVSLAMVPIPIFFRTYGEKIRTNPKFQVKL